MYPTGIDVFGASASGLVGSDNVAGEVSIRQGAALLARSDLGTAAPPRGDTAHGQVSIIAKRPASALWDQVTLQAELAANTLLGAWWVDGVVALGIAAWAVVEGRRAWAGRSCGCASRPGGCC